MPLSVLVTGGLGFIGHLVSQKLEQKNSLVTIIDNRTTYGIVPQDQLDYLINTRQPSITTPNIFDLDISDSKVHNIFESQKPDVVVHMASFPRQKVVNANPQWGSESMIGGLLNLLEASVKNGCKRFVYISSSMVYGDFEDQVTETAECNPLGQYGIMKLTGEWLVKDYTKRHGIEHVIIRPSAVYGPKDVDDRVVSKFLLAALKGDTLRVNGAQETLDFTYVDDLATGITQASVSPNTTNQTYNITRSRSRSLLEAAELAVSIAGKGSIQVNQRDFNFPSRGALNIDAARRDFDYSPTTDIEVGFKSYYEWLDNSVFWNQKTVQ